MQLQSWHEVRSPNSAALLMQLRPRCSLTPATARMFITLVGGTTVAVATFFTLRGFWPVLPFAGLEVGLLAWATSMSMRNRRRLETIYIEADRITIRHIGLKGEAVSVFPRHWARVTLHAPPTALHPSRLLLESHGRAREVGRFLTEDERRALAVRLKQLVGNVNESPTL
jgi:uncharacterized membrane protein